MLTARIKIMYGRVPFVCIIVYLSALEDVVALVL